MTELTGDRKQVQNLTETQNKDYYWKMYADVWAFHKKYIHSIRDDDLFWEGVTDESNAIAKSMTNVNS